jgi:hypothetical protein
MSQYFDCDRPNKIMGCHNYLGLNINVTHPSQTIQNQNLKYVVANTKQWLKRLNF